MTISKNLKLENDWWIFFFWGTGCRIEKRRIGHLLCSLEVQSSASTFTTENCSFLLCIYILWVLQYRVFFLGIIGIIGCGSPTFFYGAWEGALCCFGSIKASFEPACLWPHMHSIFWGRWRHQCCSHKIVLLLWINVMTSMLYCCWFYWYFYRDWVLGEFTI